MSSRNAFRAGLVALLTGLCAAPTVAAESLDQLYAAAKKEGAVVWYTTFPLDEATPIGEKFTEHYPGVRVEIVRGSGTRIVERFETEYRAGRAGADVMAGALLDPFLKWRKEGWLTEYHPPEGAKIPDQYKDEGFWYLDGITVSCMLYSPERVKPSEVPSSPMDLLDVDRWKGRVGSIPAWATGTALEWAYYVDIVLGHKDDYAPGLRKLDPPMESAQAKLVQQVIRGEIDIAMPIADYNFYRFRKDGADVACAYPKGDAGIPTNPRPMAIPNNAPHPNAAKLFLNWRLSEEGQTAMQDGFGMRSVREGMGPPNGLVPTSDLKILILDPAKVGAARDDIIARWRTVFGK